MFKRPNRILYAAKVLWKNSLPVDPRKRMFAVLIGMLDLLAFVLAFAGYRVLGVVCFAAATVVVIVAYRMKGKWD